MHTDYNNTRLIPMNRTTQDRIKKALPNINISMTIHNQKIEYTSHINRKPHKYQPVSSSS